ncbi:ACP5 [Symbiodinium natans]|uniref:ACP5 protein n=1 Tax=Symbiodinium natans TaxID=878477 RepID=A0A812IC58_9DINO|nr:ACP5 [Symbiodinium natans]
MCTCARGWLAVLAVLSTPLGCHGEDESLPTRIASFMVIGDWGWDRVAHGNVQSSNCQRIIANRMHQEFNDLGDVKFVINVGDSFYPGGVSSKQDQQWHSKWRSRYSPSLRSVPWYSVYGNHDMLYDPGACSSEEDKAAQINYDVADLDHFFMPGFSWYFQHEDLDLEVLALDLNSLWVNHTCPHTPCEADCRDKVEERAKAALELFNQRMETSNASNLLVFSHYPTDYLWGMPEVLGNLSNGTRPGGLPRHVEYFGGHRHNVDQESTTSIYPNNNWLVGGGGGWSCDGREQGFVVGEILSDGSIVTRPVLVDYCSCCGCGYWWWRP